MKYIYKFTFPITLCNNYPYDVYINIINYCINIKSKIQTDAYHSMGMGQEEKLTQTFTQDWVDTMYLQINIYLYKHKTNDNFKKI
jgi:hypothetical protein